MPRESRDQKNANRRPLSLAEINAGSASVWIGGGSVQLERQPATVRAAAPSASPNDGKDGQPSLPSFWMSLYSGGIFNQWWSEYPLVLDTAGCELPSSPIPATGDHVYCADCTVGHIESARVVDHAIECEGVFSGVSELRDAIVAAGKNGFPWQASMGADVLSAFLVKSGESAIVNGRTFNGPIYVINKSRLREGAFTQLGADFNTSARVAAMAATNSEEPTMPETTTLPPATASNIAASAPAASTAANPDVAAIAREAANMSIAAERQRIHEVTQESKGNSAIALRAISEGWDANRTAQEVVRAGRDNPAPFNINAGRSSVTPNEKMLAASICMANGTSEANAIRAFGQQNVELADAHFRRASLREIVRICAAIDGIQLGNTFGDGTEMVRAAVSSISLPNVLDSAARRTLLDAYQINDIVAMKLCAKRPVNDFKTVKRVRLLSNGNWETVGKDGQVKHGRLGEQSYSASADTKGELVTLTRQDIINDDLGAFLSMFTNMGIAAMNTIDTDFITKLLSATIITGGNLISGGTSVFGLDGLALLHKAFRKFKAGPGGTKNDNYVNVMPKHLLVPPELEISASQLIGSDFLVTGANQTVGSKNPLAGRYSLNSHPLLSDTAVTGNSTTAFFLFADPAQVGAFELSLLNGVDVPTVMRANTPANVLGISFVGYIDYGVTEQDARGVAKSAGA